MRWDFFVRHYDDDAQQRRDPKYRRTLERRPRRRRLVPARRHARRLHGAQRDDPRVPARLRLEPARRSDRRFVVARRADARLLRAARELRPPAARRALRRLGINPSRHGWDGWLAHRAAGAERGASATATSAARSSSRRSAALRGRRARSEFRVRSLSNSEADPNDWRVAARRRVGIRYTPLTTHNHVARRHARAPARRAAAGTRIGCRSRPTRWPRECCSTTSSAPSASSISKGERLYRAHAQPSDARWRAAPGVRLARSDPGRRRLQHAAAADALGHRRAAISSPGTASPCASTCPASARTCRIATRSRSSTGWRSTAWKVLEGATFTTERRAVSRVDDRAGRRVHDQRRAAVGGRFAPASIGRCRICSATRCSRRSPATSRAIRGYLPEQPELPDLGRPEGTHEQHRRPRDAAIGRSARPSARQLPLLRRRQRRRGDDDLTAVVDGDRVRPQARRRLRHARA